MNELIDPDRGSTPAAPSSGLFRAFGWYTRRYLRRHFHAVRLAGGSWLPGNATMPLLIYLNHASWWDPLVGVYLAGELFKAHVHHAFIESAALARYRFFERLGFIGIDPNSAGGEGAGAVLRAGRQLLREGSALWVTPQGAFVDPRRRPVAFRPGVAHLARRMEAGLIVPVAIEYPFWKERTPEALVRIGQPVEAGAEDRRNARQWLELLQDRMRATQDALAADAMSQDPAAFRTLLAGRAGVGGMYDLWRRSRAWWRGESFRPEHASS